MTTKNNLNKVIITGGAGFIGSNLIKKLLENGTEEILIIDDLSTGKLNNLEKFSNNFFTKLEPMNPAPPVITTLLRLFFIFIFKLNIHQFIFIIFIPLYSFIDAIFNTCRRFPI